MTATVVKSARKPRGMMVTVVAVAAVVAYVVFGFLPAQKSLNAKRRELQDKQQFIAGSQVKQAQVVQLEQQLKLTRTHLEPWRQHAKSAGSPVTMLGEIASLASAAGVELHRVTPQDPSKFETISQHTFAVEVEGSYSQIFSFLAGIESRPETIWVPKLALKISKENGQSVQCALDIAVFADNQGNSG
jgi:Tfp pilus assembly protein PilO